MSCFGSFGRPGKRTAPLPPKRIASSRAEATTGSLASRGSARATHSALATLNVLAALSLVVCSQAAEAGRPRTGGVGRSAPGELPRETRGGVETSGASFSVRGARDGGGRVWHYRPAWTTRSVSGHGRIEAAVVRHVNALRKRLGLHPLRVDPRLTVAARQHTQEMAQRGYYAHASPVTAWRSSRQRACYAGYLEPFVSENIGLVSGYADVARALFESWRRSPGHYRNMVDAQVTRIGVGVANVRRKGRSVWIATQMFGALPLDIRSVAVHRVRRRVLRVQATFATGRPLRVTVWRQRRFGGRLNPRGQGVTRFRYQDDLALPMTRPVGYQFAVTEGRRTPLVCAELNVGRRGRVTSNVVEFDPLCRQIHGFRAQGRLLQIWQDLLSFEVRRGDVQRVPRVRLFVNRTFGPVVSIPSRGWTRVSYPLPHTPVVKLGMVVDRLEKQYLLIDRRRAQLFACP